MARDSELLGRHWVYSEQFYAAVRELPSKSVSAQHEKMTKTESVSEQSEVHHCEYPIFPHGNQRPRCGENAEHKRYYDKLVWLCDEHYRIMVAQDKPVEVSTEVTPKYQF